MLANFERLYGAQRTAPLYCSVDPELYFPERVARRWELGYLGTFAPDRQHALESLLPRSLEKVLSDLSSQVHSIPRTSPGRKTSIGSSTSGRQSIASFTRSSDSLSISPGLR